MEVILPVLVDMIMVAAESLSSTTARVEARTVISEPFVSVVAPGSIVCGVSVPVAYGAILNAVCYTYVRLVDRGMFRFGEFRCSRLPLSS